MKKRTMKERKEAFKKAYYAELKKQGVMDTPEETKEPTRAELMKEAKGKGLEVNSRMTKADLVELIEAAERTSTTENITLIGG